MMKFKKKLSIILTVCMLLSLFPSTAMAASTDVCEINGTTYPTLNMALAAAIDGDTITLLSDFTEVVSYTLTTDKNITINGAGYTITGGTTPATVTPEIPENSIAMTLQGNGSITLENLTLQAGTATGIGSLSAGMYVNGIVNVFCQGIVNAYGGNAFSSYGIFNNNTGTVNLTNSIGADYGVFNNSSGDMNITSATGTGDDSTGLYNSESGNINVYEVSGGKYGVQNDSSSTGTVNVKTAIARTESNSTAVRNGYTGTINVESATGYINGVSNEGTGTVNVSQSEGTSNSIVNANAGGIVNVATIIGNAFGSGKINTGDEIAMLTLNKGLGTTCVLSAIPIAKVGDTTVGVLPTVYKNEIKGIWYAVGLHSTEFSGPTITSDEMLYSSFCTTISGTIYNKVSLLGLAAMLQLKDNSGNNVGSAFTAEADGTFKIWNVPAGSGYSLNVTLTDYIEETINNITVSETSVDLGTIFLHHPLTVGTNGGYSTLTKAISAACDGDTIKLLENIVESAVYNEKAVTIKTFTIDGQGYTVTGEDGMDSIALDLHGLGTVILKNITLQGGTATGFNSIGLSVSDLINVKSDGTTNAIGGDSATYSYGLLALGTGNVDITYATSGIGTSDSMGVMNISSGTVNVNIATGGSINSLSSNYGIYNFAGTVNVGTASASGVGSACGVSNRSGTVNVHKSVGVSAMPGGDSAVVNDTGIINVAILQGKTLGENINTGSAVTTLTLNKGDNSSCVLDFITVAKNGTTTVGALPSVFQGGVAGTWYTNGDKSVLFNGTTATAATTLFSSFYKLPVVTPETGNDGSNNTDGGNSNVTVTPQAPIATATTTTTIGNKTIETVTATAKSDSKGNAAVSITAAQITDAIRKSMAAQDKGSNASIEIKVENDASSKSVSTTIPQASLSSIAGSSVNALTISSTLTSITFNAAALDTISGNASGDLKITSGFVDASALTDAEKVVVAGRPVYDFTITSGDTTISSFGSGSAKIEVSYTLATGEDFNKIIIYYLSDSGELIMVPNCVYDTATGKVTFTTTHFSNYVVGYKEVNFSDVSGTYADGIYYLAARDIISGTGNGMFSPDHFVTKAQFVTFLVKLSGANLDIYTASSFNDVRTTDWYFSAVQWSVLNNIVSGYDGNFNPNAYVSREQMAVMLYNYAKYAELDVSNVEGMAIREFSDAESISDWSLTAIRWAISAGIINGNSDGSFGPKSSSTRAQSANVIATFLQRNIH